MSASLRNCTGCSPQRKKRCEPLNALMPTPHPHEILAQFGDGRTPDATVIIPIWNGAQFLPDCFDHVFAQQDVAIELVLVDDGSTDGSAQQAIAILRDNAERLARAVVVRHATNAGPAAARNTGMRLATTGAALLLDVDNVIYPRCVRRCLDALAASEAAFVYPILRRVGLEGGLLSFQLFDRVRLARGNYIDNLSMVRRSVWAEVGGFPEDFEALEDYAFWLRLIEHGHEGAAIPEILGTYRVHDASRTNATRHRLDAVHAKLRQLHPWIGLAKKPAAGPFHSSRYIDLMIRILANTIYGDASIRPDLPAAFDPALRAEGRDWPAVAHTMAGTIRLQNLAWLVERTLDEAIPGDYIETGVWRGGCCILMRAVLAERGEKRRRIYAADSFAGLPPPGDGVVQDRGDTHHEVPQLAVSLDQVRQNFQRYGLLDEQVVFVEGFFEDTLPALAAGPFALLRLDGDMYGSTKAALDALYPRLSPGGFVIVDDYGAVEGCRIAVDEYRRQHGISAPLAPIDWTGVWWRKPLETPAAIDPPSHAAPSAREAHNALAADFSRRCAEEGIEVDPRYFWYHTVDLGNGIVTPGSFDYRASIDAFGFPPTLAGLRALDVGSATGFFAFELERRGAAVVSVELPALSAWDSFPGESTDGILAKMRDRLAFHSLLPPGEIAAAFADISEAELHHILLDGPFRFCHARLRSRVERVYSTIYGLGEALGEQRFDLVMLGDILVHSVDPLAALASAAALCRHELVIADEIIGDEADTPALRYVGGPAADADIAEWWRPNITWYRQVLTRLGFRTIEIGPPFATVVRPGGETLPKRVIHAFR